MTLSPLLRRYTPTRRAAYGVVALAVGATLWLPSLRLFYPVDTSAVWSHDEVPEMAREIARRQLALWTDPELRGREISRMRRSNAEWDFMGRSFLVWSLGNLARRDPAMEEAALEVMDTIIANTVRLEEEHGFRHFLLAYADDAPWVHDPPLSLFVDSEIALMIAVRRLVEEKDEYRPLLQARVRKMEEAMSESSVLCAESYPDECWMFDVANALAAMKIADVLDGTDHSAFFEEWHRIARERLVHHETGLLVSEFDVDGLVGDGPEGSTIWWVAHSLSLVYPEFARDQYERAERELGLEFLGFGFGKEWPESWRSPSDIDSGFVIPGLEISPSSSGLAMVAASHFGDREYLEALVRSLVFVGFPVRDESGLHFAASSQVGDAVLLYALTLGPLWEEVREREAARAQSPSAVEAGS